MKIAYVSTLAILLICMMAADAQVVKSERDMARALHRTLLSVPVVVITGVIASLAGNEKIALIAQGLHNGTSDSMLILLFLFIVRFTGFYYYLRDRGRKYEDILNELVNAAIAVSIIDTISLVANALTGHAFTLIERSYEAHGTVNVFVCTGTAFRFHQLFVYAIGLTVLLALIIKIIRTKNFYRVQYVIMLGFICFAIVVDIMNSILDMSLDISLYSYILLGILMYIYPFCYMPQHLTSQVMNVATENLSAGVICYNSDGECLYANNVSREIMSQYYSMKGLSEEFLKWIECSDVRKADDEKKELTRSVGAELHYYDVETVVMRDEHGGYLGTFFMINDRTEDMKRHEHERFLASHDAMTRVYNREYFYYKVRKLLDKHPDTRYYMLYSNIKDFKLLNQLFGVSKGNDVLIAFADVLREECDDSVVYGRLTSDHFGVCIPVDEFSEERVANCVANFGDLIDSETYHVNVYFGVYEIIDKNEDIAVMCDRANMALNKIKDSRQYGVAYYTEELMQDALYEKMITSEFELAVAAGQFKLFLQPQCDYNGKADGAEGLVRWIHPERGMVPPGQFISVFEKTGLIHRLDSHIWELACKKLVDWQSRGFTENYISVNISPTDFYYLDIYKTFTELVEQYHIPPKNLRLEITESAIMSDFEKNIVLIDHLQDYGFIVEIDDFGSGYSSLNTLKDMNVDVLKIDMVFLRETQYKRRSQVILNNVINMAHELDMSVVVEGVETVEQLEFLNKLGCEQYQGYYFSKPVSEDEFEAKWLNLL